MSGANSQSEKGQAVLGSVIKVLLMTLLVLLVTAATSYLALEAQLAWEYSPLNQRLRQVSAVDEELAKMRQDLTQLSAQLSSLEQRLEQLKAQPSPAGGEPSHPHTPALVAVLHRLAKAQGHMMTRNLGLAEYELRAAAELLASLPPSVSPEVQRLTQEALQALLSVPSLAWGYTEAAWQRMIEVLMRPAPVED